MHSVCCKHVCVVHELTKCRVHYLNKSMYDTHANEDICDFKRGVCHKPVPVTLTNFLAVA